MDSQPTKIFIYVRVSGDSQLDGDGFPRQIAACREYASRHDLKIAKIYREEAVSGTEETMNRPAWSAMMDELLANGVRVILIERLDRLSRWLMIQEATVAQLGKLGITLLSTRESELMSEDESHVALRQMMGVFAQYERTKIVNKLRAARTRLREANGRCEGRKPYGFRPGETKVLRQIRDWHAQGLNPRQIAAQLNEAKVAPRKGQQWRHSTVQNILRRVTLDEMSGSSYRA